MAESRLWRVVEGAESVNLPRDGLADSLNLAMHGIFLVRHQVQEVPGKILVPLMTSDQAVEECLIFPSHGEERLFTSHQSRAHILCIPFQGMHAILDGLLDGLHRCTDGLGCGRHFGACREGVPMDQCLSRCSPLNLSQTGKITSLEAPLAMFEFPQWRIGRCRMKDVAHFLIVSGRRHVRISTSTNLPL
jgi:hypothetical protein